MDPTLEGISPVVSTPNGVNTGQTPPSFSPPSSVAPVPGTPGTPLVTSLQPLSQQPTVDVNTIVQQMAQYETRLRDLQSSRDRTAEEANRAKQELDALKSKHTEILSGAADAARQALEKASQLEQQLQQERARSLKAEALAAHPELAPYAELIPATTNQEELNQRITALQAARERDLSTQQQNSNMSPNSRTIIPPANPARPNPTAPSGPSTQQMETDLRAAMEQALAQNNYSLFEQAVQAQIRASGLNRES